jgi:hypothetical protein
MDREKILQITQTVQSLPKPSYLPMPPVTNANTIGIDPNCGGVIARGDGVHYLATAGVEPCVAVIFKTSERVGLVHFRPFTPVKALDRIMQHVRHSSDDPVEVTLWGGQRDISEETIGHILAWLKSQANVTVKYADVLHMKGERPDAIITSVDGKLSLTTENVLDKKITWPPRSQDVEGNGSSFLRISYVGKQGIDALAKFPKTAEPIKNSL